MATRKLSFLEKVANNVGVIYRFQKLQFPRRWDILTKVVKRELAPPTTKDWPVIQRDFKAVMNAIEKQEYKNYTVAEALVYAAVLLEIIGFFFVGEIIGRRHMWGYIVPADYVSKDAKKAADALPPPGRNSLL